MEYDCASQCDMVEQVDLSLEDQQERVINLEECVVENEEAVANLENEINDGQNETECEEHTQMVTVNKMMNNIWDIVRDNTKAAIKCEVKGSIVSRAIDIRLQEFSIKRKEQEAEIQELLNQDNIINEQLRLELINQVPLLTELGNTDVIVNFLDEQVTRNVERYRQLERGKKELSERAESMTNFLRRYENEKQNETDEIISKIQEATTVKNNLSLDFENDMVRLKQELAVAEGLLQEAEETNTDIKQKIEENENECEREFNKLTEMEKKREKISKELDDVRLEELEQDKTAEEGEQRQQLDVVQGNLKKIENTFADVSRSLNANRENLEESRSLNLVNSERVDDVKQTLKMYEAKYEEEKQEFEKTKSNYESELEEAFKKTKELEFKLSTLESDVTTANEENMDISSKLAELRKEKHETSVNEDQLKLQKRLLEREFEENCFLVVKYEEQSKGFSILDSLKASYDETMKKYTCEVDEDLKNGQEKRQHLLTELEEIKETLSSALKHRQEKFDIIVEDTKKEASELQEKGEQNLQDAQQQAKAAANALSVSKEEYKKLHQQYNVAIRKRDVLGKKLNLLGKLKSQNTGKNQNQEISKPSPVGILKAIGKRTPEKKVRFHPAGPSWDTLSENSSENIFNCLRNKGNPTSTSSEVQRHSPPICENSKLTSLSNPD